MNILLVDGNEKEASDRYTKLGMDTQYQVYEKILKKYSNSKINLIKESCIANNVIAAIIKRIPFELLSVLIMHLYQKKNLSNI